MNRNVRFWLVLLGAMVVVTLIIGGSGGDGPPYDPRSVNPDGARGIVETLERLGAGVTLDVAVPGPDSTSALMLQDRLTVEDQTSLRRWVSNGGVLVVADLSNDLAARGVGVLPGGEAAPLINRERCSIEALGEANQLRSGGRLLDAFGLDSCFGDASLAFVVAEPVGVGTVVTIGSPDVFTNAQLDQEDAAVLALALLAPNRDRSHVTFIGPSLVDFGEEGLRDLVPPRVSNAILQLLAAFLFYALYRSRRLGGVVAEPLPVRIEGSELVLKAGVLSERAKDPGSAATVIRTDVMQRARKALAIAPTEDDVAVSQRIAERTELPLQDVQAALLASVTTEGDLIDVTMTMSEIDRRLYKVAETESVNQ